jgi:hypothetical protein|tara:strand:+ start:746 stop:1141 length:396 start_codon:yes stop_codon:yes gene_type:complete
MRKFLKVIEESKPGNNSQYVISIEGPAKLEDINVSGDEYTFDLHQKIKAVVEGRADVVVHEDQEDKTTDNDRDVELAAASAKTGIGGAIAGAMGGVAQKAKKAVKRREKVIKAQLPKKIADYEAMTSELEK